ncbi:S-layer homology domain-containing protein [Dysosmobacter sp.]|uniref:S-layer homology domain-containing protein n=1 Tax=Dysosmobacter sp. TaxID=2591382 RepID=UPI0026151924|nr:S-layer homology domain-containing protein [Dysosmobacter sp.]
MKKFLSLVLALTMTMSLVTVSAGAKDFTDNSKIEYKEAVDVVSALGIVEGYEDGAFNPQNTLTRGAAAKIICNLILGTTTASALRADTAPYSDVPTTNTFAGYIAYCQKEGIISGYADGTFRPAATLTGYAFMKMLLGALGYDSEIEGYTGSNWSIAVGKRALGIELDDGNDKFVGTAAVTREEACLYAFNTLKATMVEYDAKTTVSVEGAQVTVGGSEAKNVSQDGYKSYTGDSDDTTLEFCEKNFDKLKAKDDTNGFDAPATKWTYDGDEIGTYDKDADATLVVADAEKSLETLITDGDYMDISSKDIDADAKVFFNGLDLGKYSAVKGDDDLAGKGDIIDVYENNDNDVETIVIRSYTYAKIDAVDDDLSTTLKNRDASVELSLVDINGDSLGNGDYYDDYNSDEKVLNGYNADYEEGTVLAVALAADAADDDAILDSYVVETVTGTPSASRKVETTDYANFLLGNYQGAGKGVKNGSITVDGTKYNYAAQFTGLTDTDTVDFNKEYNVYLTAEGYVLAVDGDVTASLSDVYYVTGYYKETKAGSDSTYVQAVSLKDGTVQELKVDTDVSCDLTTDTSKASSTIKPLGKLYKLDEDSNKWSGDEYTSTKYTVTEAETLEADVTSTSSVVRTDDVYYLDDSTFFISVEKSGADIDVKTATGVMSMDCDSASGDVKAIVIANDNDALVVIYIGDDLNGATSAADIVYLDSDANTENKDGWEGSLWFMDELNNEDVTIDQAGAPTQGFYRYTMNSDGIYELKSASGDKIGAGEVGSSTSGTATGVYFTTARSNAVTAPSEGQDADGNTYYNTVVFVGTSMSGATVIDTRSSSAMKADDYSNEINTTSKLVAALNKGYVKADVYVEDGKVTFIAVTECANA